MKIYQIHELNSICLLMLIDACSSAFEHYLKMLAELGRCIREIRRGKIKFDEGCVKKEEYVIGKIVSRRFY